MGLWARYTQWRYDRLSMKVASTAVHVMIECVEQQLGRELADDEIREYGAHFVSWLARDLDAHRNELLDNPVRAITMFLTDEFGTVRPDFSV